ncbi:hypothetical protein BSIN_1265 [Burkholderia singularis]|uniref:Uncharacterized protein n=1 Tax=Burkholderia singularis TaxID=1503053 RepID=A0A238GYA1_9BURK|nr:hypothetical protein BSIN_1265 [Burkholderia singularis]
MTWHALGGLPPASRYPVSPGCNGASTAAGARRRANTTTGQPGAH